MDRKENVVKMKRIPSANLIADISYNRKAIVSRVLFKKERGMITLFAFDADQGLSEHTSPYDAVVQILEGRAEIGIGGKAYKLGAGELIVMPANVPHSVKAISRFKMLLTMIRS